jgi:hypothetical protein
MLEVGKTVRSGRGQTRKSNFCVKETCGNRFERDRKREKSTHELAVD